jgi:hypothetical protein
MSAVAYTEWGLDRWGINVAFLWLNVVGAVAVVVVGLIVSIFDSKGRTRSKGVTE